MLSSHPSQSMHPPRGIHFRNPFTEPSRSHSHYNHDLDVQSPSSGYGRVSVPVKRLPTPPPDMNTVAPNVQSSQYYYYGDRSAALVKHDPVRIKHEPNAHSQPQPFAHVQPKQEAAAQSSSRPRSPIFTQNPVNNGDRSDSKMNAIAPSLQIPRSVNSSQGSLSELAAQVTSLFWFESSATLDRAEDPATYNFPLQPLVPDAIPTTGFRKWVTTILSTTQVAQNVIILALLFIYRLKQLNPTVRGKPGSEYRLLTVALMLGNKFLDDNTYTNKTWAEVSGISVTEVHIMEVEFLSNMKYALFTSAEEWAQWQTKLGRFAGYFEQASRLPASQVSASMLGITLPSPPVSNHASPPYSNPQGSYPAVTSGSYSHNSTPAPLGPAPDFGSQKSRKRSFDSYPAEPPSKRQATAAAKSYGPSISSTTPSSNQSNFLPRLPLPSLAVPHSQPAQSSQPLAISDHQQQYGIPQLPPLPPLNHSQRPYGITQPPTSTWSQNSSTPVSTASYSHTPIQLTPLPQSVPQSRHQSPYPGSAGASPTNGSLQPAGQAHSSQLSPTYYLEQRNSPYRPIRGVSTLLVPPPSHTAQQPQSVDRDQMHYQPLGRPQERQAGQLPYIAQNQWFDNQHTSGASSYQWPSFLSSQQQRSAHQHPSLPNPAFGRV